MNLEPAPRQSKMVYLAVDAGLLLTAFLIVFFAKDPYAPLPFVSAVLCVVLAAIIGLIPFLTDYAADSAEYVQAERGRVAEQVQRLHAASESLGRAAAQIKAVEEAVHKAAHTAENLPYRMQEKLAEFNETLATKDNEDREVLERELEELRAANSDNLKGVADKVARATSEWTALEAATRKQLAAAQDSAARLNDQLKGTLATIEGRIAELQQLAARTAAAASTVALAAERRAAPVAPPLPVAAAPAPVEPDAPAAAPDTPAPVAAAPSPAPAEFSSAAPETPVAPPSSNTASPFIESITLSETPAATAPLEEAKPKKPRAPRKPRPEETLAAMSAEPAAEIPAAAEQAAPAASDEPVSRAAVEASASSDGATRLLVTAYIGIGNKLFLRGEGPGLSWEKGVPMQFVSIGKWGWASQDVTAPVKCKLYKNDETAALSGDVTLEPGKHIELTALF